MKSNTYRFAEKELSILSQSFTDPQDRPAIEPFKKEILALCEKFGKSGQSGGSAPYVATAISHAIKKLLLQEPICGVTGLLDEWMEVSERTPNQTYCAQNKRCSALFKEGSELDPAYYLDAIVWKEENGNGYCGSALLPSGEIFVSRNYVKSFPFTPKTFYIDVVKEILPEDWNQEPFIEWDYYDTKYYEATGERLWKKEKYRNIVKNPKQLKKVFEYYNKYEYKQK